MPPRITSSVADAVVRSTSRPRSTRRIALTLSSSSRSALTATASFRSPPSTDRILASSRSFTCSSCQHQQQQQPQQQRQKTATTSSSSSSDTYAADLQASTPPSDTSPMPQRRLPRWSQTPAGLRAPFPVRKNEPANRFAVNEDPALLDRAWESVFGQGGAALCPPEVKWLAVTHKSFDQGRRGFNDRLCFLGKRIVDLQTSLAVLAQGGVPEATPAATSTAGEAEGQGEAAAATFETDDYGREIFQHPVGRILPRLTPAIRADHTNQRRLALLARDFGLHAVVRWKPRAAADLQGSGHDVVIVQALYAMIGALALHKGGDVAVKAVRARILPRLGLDV